MQTSVRLPMQSAVRCNLCQAGLTVTFCALSLSDLLFMEGDDVQPPSTTLITAFSGLGKARSTLLLDNVVAFPWPLLLHWTATRGPDL
jgi:hypothetical protein